MVTLESHGSLYVLTLGLETEKAIVLTQERMDSLRQRLVEFASHLEKDRSIKGLVIMSPLNLAFCVGADINAIKDLSNLEDGIRLAKQGQEIFSLIENLSVPVIAAIKGPCVGGGCEMALACDYRLIVNDDSSKIGLPETKLGILPGFGGTQRLPRLIGLPKALDIILQGKILGVSAAKKLGLIDKAISGEASDKDLKATFLNEALIFSLKGKRTKYDLSLVDWFLSRTLIGRYICQSQAIKATNQKTKGKYPALVKAIKCASTISGTGYDLEARELGSLVISPESKALVHIFFLTEAAQKLAKKNPEERVTSLGIVGGGVMGRGLAASAVRFGIKTIIAEPAEKVRLASIKHVKDFLSESKSLSKEKRDELFSLLSTVESAGQIRDCDLIVEAIVEDLKIKREVFSTLEAISSENTVLASNTSSLKLSEVLSLLKYKDRGIGFHLFNPVEKMPLVELIRTDETSDKALVRSMSLVAKLNKYPVVVKDVPGFLVNRILSPYLAEASLLLTEGVPMSVIDKVVSDFGFPMGPFRLLDEVGLDIAAKVEKILSAAYGDRMKGSDYLAKMVDKGMLGRKSAKGFYIYEQNNKGTKPAPNILELQALGISVFGDSVLPAADICDRLILSMIREGMKCFEEGVAGIPGEEAKSQIDLASIMGFGFPPFLGGLMYYASKLGSSNIEMKAQRFKDKGPRFI